MARIGSSDSLTYGLGKRTALWNERWPLIALQECIDQVAAAPRGEKEAVRWQLPCQDCPKNTACLTAKQKELGGLLYDREIRTKPRAAASSLFPFDSWLPMLKTEMQMVKTFVKPFGDEARYVVVTGWDIAWSEKSGGDWLAKFTAVKDRQTGKKRILDIDRWQRKGFQEQMGMIEESWGRYRDDLVVIEDAFAQRIWVQYLSTTTQVPVLGHGAGDKKSFQHGVPGLLLDIERQVWEVPYAPDGYKIDMVKLFLSEAEAFGWQDDKLEGVGEHDDTVMAWWHCNWGLEKMSTVPIRQISSRIDRGVEI